MKYSPFSLILLFFFLLLPSPLPADDTGLSIEEITIQDGVLHAGYTSGSPEINPELITLYVREGDDCRESRFLGWTIPEEASSSGELITTWPSTLKSGKYTFTLVPGSGKVIPSSCEDGSLGFEIPVVYQKNTIDSMKNYLESARSGTGPDYQILDIQIPDGSTHFNPGQTVSVTATIRNAGDDDTSSVPVLFHAYAGLQQLEAKSADISPMKAEEEETAFFRYLIPDFMEYGAYPLTMVADQNLIHKDRNPGDNIKTIYGSFTVLPVSTEETSGCSGCHESWNRLKEIHF